ncbi:hypothetical protein OBBRIDRAFT_837685 [Obba rivulosa]|uniref:GST N-terminal domain-containing protein n=1 Tax=Obba rivulosa TaxID=1052685 RepID=A0A8E2AM39_9APHY|nr:hypothetical protein OBBRIDRAFT_837685 [Obba rivulosa]
MSTQITLYTAQVSPYAQSVEIVLYEAKAKYTRYEIDLRNKPDWFAAKVNPIGQVPAMTYGGPEVPPDQPSADSLKMRESIILLEFVAELFPEAHLLPSNPVLRYKARLFMDILKTKAVPAWYGYFLRGEPVEAVFSALKELQAVLPPTGYVAGDFSIADAEVAPFLVRMSVMLESELLLFDAKPGEGNAVMEILREQQFERLTRYTHDVMDRPSFKATFDKDALVDTYKKWAIIMREEKRQKEKQS